MNSTNIQIIIAGLLGILAHVLAKVQSINKDMNTVNFKMVFNTYWRYDWPSFALSILVVLTASYVSDELLPLNLAGDAKPTSLTGILLSKMADLVKVLSFLLGLVADYFLALVMSVTKNKLKAKAIAEGATLGDITPEPPPNVLPPGVKKLENIESPKN